jgi:hypothetical protein
MPLDFPEPPKESLASLREGLQRLPARNKSAFSTESSGGQIPRISQAHQVFVLNPQEVMAGKGLDAARPTSWRYLLDQDTSGLAENSSTATAEVAYQGGTHVFSNLQHGWMANATRQAVKVGLELEAVRDGTFELRVLRLPAVRIDSVWLKNKVAGDDIVVPIRSAIESLSAFRPYSGDEFLSKIQEYLKKTTPFDNSPLNLQH